jgi:hypothetical protein
MVLTLRAGGQFEVLKESNLQFYREVKGVWRYMGEDSYSYLLRNRTQSGVEVNQRFGGDVTDVEVEQGTEGGPPPVRVTYEHRYKTFVWFFHKGKDEYAIRYELKVKYWCVEGTNDEGLAEAMLDEAIQQSGWISRVPYLGGSQDIHLLARVWRTEEGNSGVEYTQDVMYSSGGDEGLRGSGMDSYTFNNAPWTLESAKRGIVDQGTVDNKHTDSGPSTGGGRSLMDRFRGRFSF